jgi:predicted PurR-regulated permease PerM
MSFYTLKQKKNLVLGVTVVLGLFIIIALKDVFTAFLGAIIFYVLFRPFYIYLSEKKKLYRGFSAILVILISFIIIILPLTILSLMIVGKVIAFRADPTDLEHIVEKINLLSSKYLNDPNLFRNYMRNLQSLAIGSVSSIFNTALNITVEITLMYFTLYFMLVKHNNFEATLIKYMPFRERNSRIFAEELKNITYSNVLGQGLISVVQGCLVGAGFVIFGIPDAFFWAVISTFLSFLPIVGAPLVFVPAGIIALSNGDNFAGIGIIVWGFLLVTNIDNFMRLIIARMVANIHPLITIIGVVIGIPYFGILGLVFGPLLLSYFMLLVSIYESRYIRHKPLDISELRELSEKPET